MKKNFIVTTALLDTWELNENNFLIGKWCEFSEIDFLNKQKISQKTNIIKNSHHWNDMEKKNKDYKYIGKKLEELLEIISEKLSTVHSTKESKEYWRIIIYSWLSGYMTQMFDRWECIRIFSDKNKDTKFNSNFIDLNDLDYIPNNYIEAIKNTQRDLWNHLIFLRLFNFLKIENISLIRKKIEKNKLKKEEFHWKQKLPLSIKFIKFIDKIISRFALKFNRIILDSFHFPKKEYLKICLRCGLIPCKYISFFDFRINTNNSLNEKRVKLKNLLFNIETNDKFIKFILQNIHKDIPQSYLENFNEIKKIILPFVKKKKTILTMHSLVTEDNFKIYLAEAKKIGSKFIYVEHGGGLVYEMDPRFNLLDKVADTQVNWDNTVKKKNLINLSPTLPIIKFDNKKKGQNCSIICYEQPKYVNKFTTGPSLDQSVNFFHEITEFVNELDPEIKSKVKFRVKLNRGFNSEKKFADIFGESNIDKVGFNNPFQKTLSNSRLIVATYPQTIFSEAMHSNVPTILIIKKNLWEFSKTALQTFEDLKKNNIAFEDFKIANIHINRNWKEIDLWWKSQSVQLARKRFLLNFFNVKSKWYKEWSDYIYSLSSS